MVYGPDGQEYPSWEAAIAAGVTSPSYIKPAAQTMAAGSATIPTYGYELARLMSQYGVGAPVAPRTTDQSLIDQYFAKLNAPMYQEPVGNALFNQYLGIGMGRLPAPTGPMTNFFPGQAVCGDGQRFDPVTAKCVSVIAPGGVAEAGRITTGTPNIGGNQCPPGFTFNPVTRSCEPSAVTNITPAQTPASQIPATQTGPNPVIIADKVPACPPGQTRNAQGICVAVQQECPAGQIRNAQGACVTDPKAAWIAQSKSFTDDQWREAMDAWIARNPGATKEQVDAALLSYQAPERLYGYGYTESNVIDDPMVSAGYKPATQETGFLTPNVITGPAQGDIYKMLRENIQYAADPRSIGGAGITDREAQQIWDLSKAQGLSIPQIAEQVNVYGGLSKSEEDIANAIRRLAPDEAENYFKLVGYTGNAQGGLISLAKKYADGGKVEADPMLSMAKKYQLGGLNTNDAYSQLEQARSNLRSTVEQLSTQEQVKPPSKAEMYFRLASAFATPTKTGDFGESLGLAAQQMAEYKGDQREAQKAAQQQRRDLALELGKLDLETAQSAYERSLAAQQPKGTIGQNCADRYAIGSPDYEACLEAGATSDEQRRLADIARQTAATQNIESQIAARDKPPEFTNFERRLLDEYTKKEQSAKVAAGILFEAIKLNDQAYTESYLDVIRRIGNRIGDQDDPKLAIYEFMKNRLSANALASLKATFPGAISNAEREALDSLQGAMSATKEGRAMIFYATMQTMLDGIENSKAEIDKINSRYYAGPQQIDEPEQPTDEAEVIQ